MQIPQEILLAKRQDHVAIRSCESIRGDRLGPEGLSYRYHDRYEEGWGALS